MKDASLARKSDAKLATYAGLLKRVRETLILGRKKIDERKVQTYWETGRLIHTHLLLTKERAGYGEQVIQKLSKPLGVGERLLQRTLQFYRQFPRIPSGRTELNWTHYRVLSGIPNEKKRLALEAWADKGEWTAEALEEWIRRQKRKVGSGADGKPVELLVPQKGKVGVYGIIEVSGKLHWDRGFRSYRELSAARAPHFKAGDFVRLRGEDPLEKASDGQRFDLYTYETDLLRVIDADTYWMRIWIARPDWCKEKLRLRGVDAPELGTPEGEAAKRFVESLFRKASKVTITTTKPDKWDRYLSDVFLEMPASEVIFLNNLLLEKGHAVRSDKVRLEDWEE